MTDGAEAQEETEIDGLQFDRDAERLSTADDEGDIVMAHASEAPPTFRTPEITLLDVPPANTYHQFLPKYPQTGSRRGPHALIHQKHRSSHSC